MFVVHYNLNAPENKNFVLSSYSLPTEQYEIHWVKEIIVRGRILDAAVDPHNQLVYALNYTSHPDAFNIVMFDYAGTNMTVLYKAVDAFLINKIDVFNDSIVWVTSNDIFASESLMHICKPSPTCTKDHMLILPIPNDVST